MRVVALLIFLIPSFCWAQNLSLKEFIRLAEENDPEFKRIISENKKLDFLIDQGLPSRKVVLNVSNEYGFSKDNTSNTQILNGEVSKDIIETGTSLSVSHTDTKRPDRQENVTQLRLRQSLFKNFFGRDVRLQKVTLSKESEVLRLQVLEEYETYLFNKASQYFDYQQAYYNFELAQNIYKEAEGLRGNVLKKRKAQIASQTDLDRSDLQLLLAKEDLINKRRDLNSMWQILKQAIGLKSEPLKPQNQQMSAVTGFSQNMTEELLLELRPMKIKVLQEEITGNELKIAERTSDPSVNFVAGYNVDNSRRFATAINREETVLGVNLEVPIWDTQSNATAGIAFVDQLKSEFDKKATLNDLQAQWSDLKVRLQEVKERLEVSRKKVTITQRILKDEERRYQVGKFDIERVIEVKNDYTSYRFQMQSDLVEYNKLLINWLALNDQLIDKRNAL